MVVWDDLNPSQRLSLYDKGVDLVDSGTSDSAAVKRDRTISYRSGDLSAPALSEREPLGAVISEFVTSISDGRAPLTDGHAGLRVLRILEATTASLCHDGASIPLGARSEPC